MTFSDRHRTLPAPRLWKVLHRLYAGMIERRQAQADRRFSLYLSDRYLLNSRARVGTAVFGQIGGISGRDGGGNE